ncbi:unnamed protein product, partial [Cyprideis torosa]
PLPSVSRIFARPLTKKESSQADVTVNTGLLRFTQSEEDISGRMEATELASLKQQLGLKTSESSSLAIQLKEAEGRIGELEEASNVLQEQLNRTRLQIEASNVLQEQLNRTRLQIGEQSKKLEETEQNKGVLEEQIELMTSERCRLEAWINEVQIEKEELESEHAQKLEELEDEKKRIEEEKRRVEEELEDAVLELVNFRLDFYSALVLQKEVSTSEKLQQKLEELENQQNELFSTIAEKEDQLKDLKSDFDQFAEEAGKESTELRRNLQQLGADLEREKTLAEELQDKIQQLEAHNQELTSNVEQQQKSSEALETELHQLTERSQRQKEDLEKELDCVKNELEVAVLQRDEEARGAKELVHFELLDLSVAHLNLRSLTRNALDNLVDLFLTLRDFPLETSRQERIGKQAKEIEYQEGMMRSQAESILDLEEKNEVLSGKYEDLDSSIQARDMKIDNLMSNLNDAKVELATARETIENLDTKTEELNVALVDREAELEDTPLVDREAELEDTRKTIDTLERRIDILISDLTEKDAALEDQRRELLDERDTQKDLCQKLSTLEHKLEEIVLEKDAVIADLTQKFDGATEENLKLTKELSKWNSWRCDTGHEAAKDVIRDRKVELNRLKGRKRFNLEDAFQHDDAEESAAAGRLTFCKEIFELPILRLEKELDCVKNELEVAVLQRDEEARGAKELQVKLENLESHRVDLEARECSLRDLLNQLEKECESLKGNLCRAEERIGKQAKEIEYQEGMMRSQAESILDLEEKNEVLSGKYEDLDSSIQARDMKIDNLMSDLNDAKVELATARETIENLDTKTEELNVALVDREAELEDTRKTIDTLERRIDILISDLTEKDAALEDQRRELLDERDTQKDLCQKLSTLEHKLEEIVLEKDAVIADLTQKFDGATEENLKLTKENQYLTDKMSALSTDYLSLSSQYEEASSNASFFKEQYQTTDREYRISQENVKMLEGTIDDLQREKEELQETVTDLEDKIDTYRISLDDLEVELGCARTEKKGLLEEVSKLETALKELTSEKDESIRDLEGKISKLDHEKKSVTAEVQDLRERLSDAEKEIEGLGAERDRLEEEKEKASRESLAMSIAMDELREDGQREILKRDEEKEEVKRILEATVREKRCLGERVHELLEKQEEMKRKQEATDEDLIVMQELRDALDLDNEEMKSELEVVKKTHLFQWLLMLRSFLCQLFDVRSVTVEQVLVLPTRVAVLCNFALFDELESCFQGLGKDLDGAYETIAKLKREVQQLKKEKADEIADYSKLEKRFEEVEAALDEKRTELYVANTQRAGMVQDLEKFRERYSMLVGHNNPKQKIQHMNILSKEFIELKQLALRYRAQYEAAKDVIRDMKVELNRLKGRKRFNLEDAFQHDDAEESAAAGRLTFCKEEKENEMGTSTKTNQRRFDPSKAFQHHEKRTPLKGNRAQ